MPINYLSVKKHFNQAAKSYERASFLQQEIARRLLEKTEFIRLQPQTILDLGSGTGYCSKIFTKKFPKAKMIQCDLAELMLKTSKKHQRWFHRNHFVCATSEQLPFQNNSIDLIISNCMLQWCNVKAVFSEIQRVLRTDGCFLFSTFGPDTLKELQQSFQQADSYSHVHDFLDMHDLGDFLLHGGFKDPVMDMEMIRTEYMSVLSLMRDLKALGAQNASSGQPTGLMGKSRLQKMQNYYTAHFQNPNGTVNATYETIYGYAIKKPVTTKIDEQGRQLFSLDDLL